MDLLTSNPDVHFDLLILHFIELVRAKDWYDLMYFEIVVHMFIIGFVILDLLH